MSGKSFDRDQIMLIMDHEGIHVTPRELDFLEALSYHIDRIKSRDYIFKFIYSKRPECDWPDSFDKIIDVYVCKLRRKLKGLAEIITHRGIGYKLSWNSDRIRDVKSSFSPHQLI